ncbi:GDP-mannose 4,6-dehydratase [Piscinibacter sp.]|uniref:GDP-mannose 4,6-dehydratase n=1 Tax=Piscinibacter sp. TaxID=1903157 RepID=UPI001DD7785E|nr:GDP-mannose 4,6-dehydratase [Piscinibacter sp.]MBK7529582.1 GDP-mannose 4,6-dehydratase [Piscinibacter sp.]
MRVVVTGHTGFVGKNLLAHIAMQGAADVACVTLPDSFDLCSETAIDEALEGLEFDHVLHLAAQSHVPTSVADPVGTFDTNVMGTVRLLRALQKRAFAGRFLYVSSGDVYGIVDSASLPVTERTQPRPANPYAASKLAAEVVALTWGQMKAFDVIVARPFNHLGPGQRTDFAVARFADAVARIKLGLTPPHLGTGRLDVTRDFLDVRDVADAYVALLHSGRAGEIYNVCSGVERGLDAVLDELIEQSGVAVEHSIDSALVRPVDLPRMVGSASRLKADTGWESKISFADTLREVLTHQLRTHRS